MCSRWSVCDNAYPGTREGVILVVEITTQERRDLQVERSSRPNRGTARRASPRRARGLPAPAPRGLQPEDVGLPERRAPPHPRPAPRGGRARSPGWAPPGTRGSSRAATCARHWRSSRRSPSALRLTPAERTHLLLLGRGEEPPPCKPPAERGLPHAPSPHREPRPQSGRRARRRWDYLAWNRAACAVFGDSARSPSGPQPPLAPLHGPDPARDVPDWERSSRLMAAKFRADHAQHLGDPSFEQLVATLAAGRAPSSASRGSVTRCASGRGPQGRSIIRWPASCCSSTRCSSPTTPPSSG